MIDRDRFAGQELLNRPNVELTIPSKQFAQSLHEVAIAAKTFDNTGVIHINIGDGRVDLQARNSLQYCHTSVPNLSPTKPPIITPLSYRVGADSLERAMDFHFHRTQKPGHVVLQFKPSTLDVFSIGPHGLSPLEIVSLPIIKADPLGISPINESEAKLSFNRLEAKTVFKYFRDIAEQDDLLASPVILEQFDGQHINIQSERHQREASLHSQGTLLNPVILNAKQLYEIMRVTTSTKSFEMSIGTVGITNVAFFRKPEDENYLHVTTTMLSGRS